MDHGVIGTLLFLSSQFYFFPLATQHKNMLNEDVLRLVFYQCNLESSLALGQTSKACATIFRGLDDRWFRTKVLERVPWFSLPDGTVTWKQRARIICARSKKALDGRHTDDLLLFRDLSVPMAKCTNDVTRLSSDDIARDTNVRLGMTALFPDSKVDTGVLGDFKLEGTHLVGQHLDLDLRTLILKHSVFDMDDEDSRVPDRGNIRVSKKGTKVKHGAPNGWVQVMNENDNLIHVRYNTNTGVAEGIVHKATHARTTDGAILMNHMDDSIRVFSKTTPVVGLVNLLPGAGGALVLQYYRDTPEDSHVAYFEPNAELTKIILFSMPSPFDPRMRTNMGFEHGDTKFYTEYNGYMFFFIHGRFIRIWIDLGFRIQLDQCLGDRDVWQVGGRTNSRALAVWNKNFPAIGTMNHTQFANLNWTIVQGRKSEGKDRFITLDGVGGCIVGDLATGKTYVALDTLEYKGLPGQMVVAYASGNPNQPVGFYTLEGHVCSALSQALEMSREARLTQGGRVLNMTSTFNEFCDAFRARWREEEQANWTRMSTYRDVVGDGLYLLTRGQNPMNEIYLSFPDEPLSGRNINSRSHFRSVDNPKPIRKIVNSQTKKCTLWGCRGH